MGKINGCLKCLFIFFNVLFAILGCLLIYGAVKASVLSSQLSAIGSPGLGWGWLFAIGVLVVSCLGIYAGISEKDLALKIFAGFMGVGMIIMLIFGIIVVVMRNKVRDNFQNATSESAKILMSDDQFKAVLDGIQAEAQCCGVAGADDWGTQIPQSCKCSGGFAGFAGFGSSGCKSRPQGTTGPDQVYSQSCGEVMYEWLNLAFQIVMGLFFGFAVTALLGLLVSILMIHQVKRHDSAGGASIAMKGY